MSTASSTRPPRLNQKTALITGGAGSLGLAAARLYIQEGARVVLVDSNQSALQRAWQSFDPKAASCVLADVTKAEDARRCVQTTVDRHGGIDVFVAGAGITGEAAKPIPDLPLETFDRVMAVNVRGVFLGLREVIPAMAKRGGGSIIIMSSILGLRGIGLGFAAYVTSKHAVVGLMRAAALECAPLKIRVNSIHPAPVQSPMMDGIEAAVLPLEPLEARRRLEALIPLGRYAQPEEIAQLMVFLASDESRFCTGGVYPLDGGMSA